jgi:5-methyltetrahydrofolate--homocysteine methyltransferase
MNRNEVLHTAILEGDRAVAQNALRSALDAGAKPLELLHGSMISAMTELGERFARGDALLPDLMVGARAMQSCLDILEPILLGEGNPSKRARICIGSVKGDYHDIGKNIVTVMLRAAGFDVHDLGTNCDAAKFREGVSAGARAVLCSCLTVRSARALKDIVEGLSDGQAIPVIVGGAGVNEAYAAEIGAYAYGATAGDAIRILNELFPGETQPEKQPIPS